jgi:hypothetical protein
LLPLVTSSIDEIISDLDLCLSCLGIAYTILLVKISIYIYD